MANKIKFKIKSDKFSDFINKLEDLTKISDTIKLKIDNDNILMYSMLGGNVMLAFKNYLISTRDYLEYGDDMEYKIVYGDSPSDINTKVNEMINNGWELVGSHQVVIRREQNRYSGSQHMDTLNQLEYTQTMIKKN